MHPPIVPDFSTIKTALFPSRASRFSHCFYPLRTEKTHNFYGVRLSRLLPQWGGSWEAIEAFIRKWSRAQEASEGRSLYARLYAAVLSMGYTPDQTRYDWNLMKESLAELVTRFPDPWYRNLYASFACVARDDAAFRKAISAIPRHELIPGAWISGHSPEACMRWAGT